MITCIMECVKARSHATPNRSLVGYLDETGFYGFSRILSITIFIFYLIVLLFEHRKT